MRYGIEIQFVTGNTTLWVYDKNLREDLLEVIADYCIKGTTFQWKHENDDDPYYYNANNIVWYKRTENKKDSD